MHVYRKQTVHMCIKVCLYMWADICIYMVPGDLFIRMYDLHADIYVVHIPRRARFSVMIRIPRKITGTLDSGHLQMQIVAQAFDGKISSSASHPFRSGSRQ